MSAMDHWHPVMLASALGKAPRLAQVWGREVVVFRGEGGRVGALDERCPHRGMRLSKGKVEGDRIVCPYHGWCYGRDGQGESPGTPRLKARAVSYEVVERHGAIWIKPEGVAARFPDVGASGHHPLGALHHRIEAPLEVVLDNFTEVEHTPTAHLFLGYDPGRVAQVVTRVEVGERTVRVVNRGPQKPLPRLLMRLFGIEPGDDFIDEWVTGFSPVHALYDHWWADPRTGQRRPESLRIGVVMTPPDAERVDLFVFAHTSRPFSGRLGLNRWVIKPLTRRLIDHEVGLDKNILEHLADKGVGIEGKKLSRFDRPMGEHRRMIERLYKGIDEPEAQPIE